MPDTITWLTLELEPREHQQSTVNSAHPLSSPPIMASREAAILDPTKPSSPLSVPAAQTALLLMDYQNLTVALVGEDGSRTVEVACQMRDWAVEQGMSVFHCLVDTKSGAAPHAHMKMADRWKFYEEKLKQMPQLGDEPKELGPATSVRSQLETTFTRQPGYVSVLKSPGLMDSLKQKQIRSLILCGLSTSGCVMSTVRGANDEDFIVTVIKDACYDPVPALHDLLVTHAFPATAHVARANEIREAWKGS